VVRTVSNQRLAHPAPPAPARALHAAELAAASQGIGRTAAQGINALISRICFPHSEWWLTRPPASVNTTTRQVSATLLPGASATAGGSATYQAGTGNTPTTASLRTGPLVVVIAVLRDLPAVTLQRFVDMPLLAAPATPVIRPLPGARPALPPEENLTRDGYATYVQARAQAFVAVVRWYLRRELTERFLSTATRFRWGHAIGIQLSARTATVQYDSTDAQDGPGSEIVGWGTRTWTARTLVGHRVRVVLAVGGKWIDDLDDASGRVAA
jgi:hypothetical protein